MNIPLGRIGSAEDISSAVFHLVENKYITGQIIRVDGGRSLN
jgi:pteridine reductase